MKQFTLLLFLLTVSFGYSQAPTVDPTTPPARDAADVISIFSAAYSNISGADYNPNWGQSGFNTANTAYDTGSGNLVLAYPNFNYQGIDFNGVQNVAAMEYLHFDIWTDDGVAPNIYVISSGGEIPHTISNVAGSWQSIDLPIAGITGDPANAIQFKFDGGNGSTNAIYVDNLYFWKAPTNPTTDATLSDLQVDTATISGFSSATFSYTYELPAGTTVVPQITTATPTNANVTSVTITQATAIPGDATVVVVSEDGTVTETYTVSFIAVGPPMAAPTPPWRLASDVISIYSDAYTDVSSNFDAGWCGASSVSEVLIDGNPTQKYLNNACQGIDFSANKVDATTFTKVHIDFYISETNLLGKVFNLKLVDFGSGSSEVSAIEINLNEGSVPAITTGTWISADIAVDLSSFTGLAQAAITSNLNNTVWYDNFYLHKDTVLSTNDFNLADYSVFPNPTLNTWNIKSDQTINKIEVYDITGKRVLSQTPVSNDVVLDASNLESGIYIAKVEATKGISQIKLIKE